MTPNRSALRGAAAPSATSGRSTETGKSDASTTETAKRTHAAAGRSAIRTSQSRRRVRKRSVRRGAGRPANSSTGPLCPEENLLRLREEKMVVEVMHEEERKDDDIVAL